MATCRANGAQNPDERVANIARDAAWHLVEAMRDNCIMDRWAVDALLAAQSTDTEAKALLVMMAACGLVPGDEAVAEMSLRGLKGA